VFLLAWSGVQSPRSHAGASRAAGHIGGDGTEVPQLVAIASQRWMQLILSSKTRRIPRIVDSLGTGCMGGAVV
jgi:hypothetical protein